MISNLKSKRVLVLHIKLELFCFNIFSAIGVTLETDPVTLNDGSIIAYPCFNIVINWRL